MKYLIIFENGTKIWLEATDEKAARKKAKSTYDLSPIAALYRTVSA